MGAVDFLPAQLRGNFKAAQAGQHHIEHDHIVNPAQAVIQPVAAGIRNIDEILFFL